MSISSSGLGIFLVIISLRRVSIPQYLFSHPVDAKVWFVDWILELLDVVIILIYHLPFEWQSIVFCQLYHPSLVLFSSTSDFI